jgi:DNA primase
MRVTADELIQRVNILDVVSQYVKLKKAGKNYSGLCPFHKEKSPSFSVSIEKQMYYCFGCREGGNAVNFLMKYENLSFQEALENLGRQYGLEVIRKGGSARTTTLDVLSKLAEFYHENLTRSGQAKEYLARRGIGAKVIEEFKLGFSDRQGERFAAFVQKAGVPQDLLFATGVVRTREKDIYDIFRGRVVIPIFDVNGRTIAFGGRTLEKDGIPKYINSPESSVFSKRHSLYGIDRARKAITEADEVLVVEGYFDLISLHTVGVRNVVSTLGTSVTEEQLGKLRNYTENITLMLDGDEAGVKSALRLITIFSDMDLNGRMVVLPDGHDPDSFVRGKGATAIEEVVKSRKPVLDYFFEQQIVKAGIETLEGKMAFLRAVTPQVERIKDRVKKRLYVKRLAELTNVEELHFWKAAGEEREVEPEEKISGNIIGKRVISALVNRPSLLESLRGKEVIQYIRDDAVREIINRMCDHFEERRDLEVNSLIETLDKQELKELVLDSIFDEGSSDEGELERVLWDYLRHEERQFLMDQARQITVKLSAAEKKGDQMEIMALLEKKKRVLTVMKSNQLK